MRLGAMSVLKLVFNLRGNLRTSGRRCAVYRFDATQAVSRSAATSDPFARQQLFRRF